ncbi:hypothetical protein FJZ19_00325 [Candidatus Pacearchaeota archaeon]|nr:hypothetical protein [Candidatus Pacearchaeota archaeon]
MINKKSQVTIFIIIAIVLIGLLIIIFYPRLSSLGAAPKTPSGYIEECMNQHMGIIENITERGGSLEPEHSIMYKENKIEYLCYTNEYYKTCTMQQPLLLEHVEKEISSYMKDKAETCLNELINDYKSKGYQTSSSKPEVSTEIESGSIKITINSKVTLTKGASENYEKFSIARNSEMYDLIMIASSILNWEAREGDSAPETFMMYYPDIKIEKMKLEDGSKIYTLTHRITGEKLVFATRSLSWPPGYGVDKYVNK